MYKTPDNKIILGNWKMNKLASDIQEYFVELEPKDYKVKNTMVGIAVPLPYLYLVQEKFKQMDWLLGSQDVSQFSDSGAYTGEVSVAMLKDFDTSFTLVGHAERRKYFNENNSVFTKKINHLLDNDIRPVLCVGETLEEKNQGRTYQVLDQQLQVLPEKYCENVILAYEPVWAIGTGHMPTDEEISSRLHYIRERMLSICVGSDKIPLLYGGSVNLDNANKLMSIEHVNGLLIGGASLVPLDFIKIIQSI